MVPSTVRTQLRPLPRVVPAGIAVGVLCGLLEMLLTSFVTAIPVFSLTTVILYGVIGATTALFWWLILELLQRLRKKTTVADTGHLALIVALCISTLTFVVVGDWAHEVWLAGISMWSPTSIFATLTIFATSLILFVLVYLALPGVSRFVVKYKLICATVVAGAVLAAGVFAVSASNSPRTVTFQALRTRGQSPQINVLLITIDTLRADHLSCYGYEGIRTPNIDRLAEEGILFELAISQSPWTLPSVASIVTGLYPTSCGAGEHVWHGTHKLQTPIYAAVPTIAEILRNNGYNTTAFVTNHFVGSRYGFAKGFDEYLNVHESDYRSYLAMHRLLSRLARRWDKPAIEDSADIITSKACRWLENGVSEPFFLWVHYLDPHDYWVYQKIDLAPGYNGSLRRELDLARAKSGSYMMTPEDIGYLKSLYDGNILYTDRKIGEILETLSQLRLDDRTLIVMTSDHGEEFLDHGFFDHGHTMYDELIHVPLLLRLPGRLAAQRSVETQVRLVDVVPTVLEILDLDPVDNLDGASLLPVIEGKERPHRPAFSERLLYFEQRKAIRDGQYKYVLFAESGREELYDLQRDPDELYNLAQFDQETAEVMQSLLLSHVHRSEEQAQRRVDTEQVALRRPSRVEMQRLKALGYAR